MSELFYNENPNNKVIKHIGLTSKDPKQIKELAQRVYKFNTKNGTNVRMEILPKANELNPEEPAQLVFYYDNNDVKMKFWLE